MLIRIPVPGVLTRISVPGVKYVIEFDSDAIVRVESPREVADVPGMPGMKELSGPNSLILHFAALDDAPKWVDAAQEGDHP